MSVNKAIILGNVGNDPVISQTQQGSKIATFSIATTDTWKDKSSGENKSKSEWHKIVAYNSNLVNLIENYVKKGSKLYLEGSLQTRKWKDKDGVEKYTTEIILPNFGGVIQLLDSKKEEKKETGFDKAMSAIDSFEDDSIPF